MRIFSFLILLLFLAQCRAAIAEPEEWLRKDDVHRKLDGLVAKLWRGSKKDAIIAQDKLEKYCMGKEKFAYYYCHVVALSHCRRKKMQKCKTLLDRTLLLNNFFVEAINSYRMFLPDKVSPHLQKGQRHFEIALNSAKKKNKEQTLLHLKKAIHLGSAPKAVLQNEPSFFFLRKDLKFKAMLASIETISTDQKSKFYLVSLKINPLQKIIDASYTRSRHRQHRDASRVLYHFYKAESLMTQNKYQAASRAMLDFINVLESKNKELAAHTILYLWQTKKYRSLKRQRHFKTWMFTKAQTYGINKNWMKKH